MEPNVTCPSCHTVAPAADYFCPNCGKKLKDKPLSTSIGKQIGIYVLSIFLPPLGLWPGLKYLFAKDQKTKIIGGVAIFLTIVSTTVTIYFTVQFMNSLNKTLNDQLNMQGLGF